MQNPGVAKGESCHAFSMSSPGLLENRMLGTGRPPVWRQNAYEQGERWNICREQVARHDAQAAGGVCVGCCVCVCVCVRVQMETATASLNKWFV